MSEVYEYTEPGEDGVTPVTHRFTREEILALYYPYWQEQMRNVGREHLISEQNCIDDWVVVNWATLTSEGEA